MAAADYEQIGSDSEEIHLLSGDHVEVVFPARPGYEQRRRLNQSGTYVYPDHGTFLGLKYPSVSSIPEMDNPTTVALNRCKERILKPYLWLLKSVGWQPIFFETDIGWQKFINVLHPCCVIFLIVAGYVIQLAACFRRDRAGFNSDDDPFNTTITNGTIHGLPKCQEYILSQYLIPDILHSAAYLFCFFTLRVQESEQLPTLMERVFLQTSPTETGFRSQGTLIRKLRFLLYGSLTWVVLSQIAGDIHIGANYKTMNFHWLEPPSEFGRLSLIILMVVSFIILDIVYVTVVINYCVQCWLLIFYVECIQEKVRERSIDFNQTMREMNEIQKHLRVINMTPGIALSIVMVNFGTMSAMGIFALFDPEDSGYTPLMYLGTGMAVLLWLSLMVLPIVIAATLSATCNSIRKIGHELRVRPFGFEDQSDDNLDSFLLFMNTLNLKAKIFLIPVETKKISTLAVIAGTILLLLFQTGVLKVWL